MQGYLKEEHEFEIEKTAVYEIGDDGNVLDQGNFKLHLSKKSIKLTKDYWNIIELSDDHYIVCDVNVSGCYFFHINEYSMDELEYLGPTFNFKFGVIRLQKDKKGEIIPFAEKTIVPIIYDGITENNEETITAVNNGKLTYIDLNPKSQNYGKQLVPAILEHAVAFSVDYKGFAECSIDGITGYLPRYCNPRKQLKSSDLLTEEQVKLLLENYKNLQMAQEDKISKLTDSAKTLKLSRK